MDDENGGAQTTNGGVMVKKDPMRNCNRASLDNKRLAWEPDMSDLDMRIDRVKHHFRVIDTTCNDPMSAFV